MICEACHQNLATVHLTEIVQKAKKETHLCEECAREKGVTYSTQFSVKDFLGGLAKKSPSPEPAATVPAVAQEALQPCASCGITFAEFRQSGRLGCHHDYEHFREQLLPLLKKIHSDKVQHTGRIPNSIGQRLEQERRLEDLRKELEQAVALENYELAADLRDQIKTLQAEEA